MKLNYILIPVITIITAFLGGRVTGGNMNWYNTISLPTWTPPGSTIGIVWTTIFVLTTISALVVWNKKRGSKIILGSVFILNAFLNVFWSFLFFGQHLIFAAAIEAILLGLSVLFLIIFIWPKSRFASILLFPYFGWVTFATYLTFVVWSMN